MASLHIHIIFRNVLFLFSYCQRYDYFPYKILITCISGNLSWTKKKNNKRKPPSSLADSIQEVGKAEKKLSKQKKCERTEAADVSALKGGAIPHSIRTRKRKKPTKDDIEKKKTEDVANEQNADGVNESGRVAVERGLKCIICQDAESYTAFITLPCNHQFHRLCMERWLKEKNCCPHCKMSLSGWSPNGRIPRIR